jgi:hypothetical protein
MLNPTLVFCLERMEQRLTPSMLPPPTEMSRDDQVPRRCAIAATHRASAASTSPSMLHYYRCNVTD